jgi:hypothetical protein
VKVHIVLKGHLFAAGWQIEAVYLDELSALRAANASTMMKIEAHDVIGAPAMPNDEETRGGERPADWRGPQDAKPEDLPKGGEPAGVPLIDALGPVERGQEDPFAASLKTAGEPEDVR